MLPRIITPLSYLPQKQLERDVEDGYIDAKIEMILRSPYAKKRLVNRKQALALCVELSNKNPDHNLCNYVFAINAIENARRLSAHPDYKKAEAFLLKTIESTGPCSKELNGSAAFLLANLYKEQKKYIEAMGWFTKALLLNSTEAQYAFYNNHFLPLNSKLPIDLCNTINEDGETKRSTWALNETTLAMVLLFENQKIIDPIKLSMSPWYLYWKDENKQKQILNFLNENGCEEILNRNSATVEVISAAIKNDPYLFYNLFSYCFENKIVPCEETYIKIIEDFFIPLVPDPRLKDKAYYHLFQIYLKKFLEELNQNKATDSESLDRALTFLGRISGVFTHYSIEDLELLSKDTQVPDNPIDIQKKRLREEIIFTIFMKLRAAKNTEAALFWAQKITGSFAICDEKLFDFFKAIDPNEENFELFKIKKRVINNIFLALKNDKPQPESLFTNLTFNQSLKTLQEKFQGPALQVRYAIRSSIKLLESYLSQRKKRKANNPFRFFPGDFFKHNDKKRSEFVNQAKKFELLDIMQDKFNYFADDPDAKVDNENHFSRQDYITLLKNFCELIKTGKDCFASGFLTHEMQKTFVKIEGILKEVATTIGVVPQLNETRLFEPKR